MQGRREREQLDGAGDEDVDGPRMPAADRPGERRTAGHPHGAGTRPAGRIAQASRRRSRTAPTIRAAAAQAHSTAKPVHVLSMPGSVRTEYTPAPALLGR